MYSYIFYLTLNKEATIPGKHFRKDLFAYMDDYKRRMDSCFRIFYFSNLFLYESTVKFLFQK